MAQTLNDTRNYFIAYLFDSNGDPLTEGEVWVNSSYPISFNLYRGPAPGNQTFPNPFNIADYADPNAPNKVYFHINPVFNTGANAITAPKMDVFYTSVNGSNGGQNFTIASSVPMGNAGGFSVGADVTQLMTRQDIQDEFTALSQNNLDATTDPTSGDDEDDGYSVGSTWINISSSPQEAFACVDATSGAAVWINTTLSISELGSVAILDAGTNATQIRNNSQNEAFFEAIVTNNFTAIADPDITNDSSEDYEVGSQWLNTASSPMELYECLDATVGAAVWRDISFNADNFGTMAYLDAGTSDTEFKTNLQNDSSFQGIATIASVDPTINDDVGSGHVIGDTWINNTPTNDTYFVCTSALSGAAEWRHIIDAPTVTSTDPTITDDSNDGYQIGSMWINTTSSPQGVFIASDVTVGAAVWLQYAGSTGSTDIVDFYIDYSTKAIWEDGDSAPTSIGLSGRAEHLYSAITTPNGDTLDNYTNITVTALIYMDSNWGDPGWSANLGVRATKDYKLTSLVVQAGGGYLASTGSYTGGSFATFSNRTPPKPCLIKITGVKI